MDSLQNDDELRLAETLTDKAYRSLEEEIVIPAARRDDWYASGVGGAAACKINEILAAVDPGMGQHQGLLLGWTAQRHLVPKLSCQPPTKDRPDEV